MFCPITCGNKKPRVLICVIFVARTIKPNIYVPSRISSPNEVRSNQRRIF